MSVNNVLRTQRLLAKIQKLKRYFQIHNIDQKHPRYERMRRLMTRYRNAITMNKDIPEEFEGLEEAIYSDKPQKDYLRLTEKEFLKKKKKEDDDSEDKRFIKKKKEDETEDDDSEDNEKEVEKDDRDDDDSEEESDDDDGDNDDDEKEVEDGKEKEKLSNKKEKIVINPVLKGRV